MKLEPNMYVRDEKGIIGKIYKKGEDIFTYKNSNRDYIICCSSYLLISSTNEILKASHNIIEILEEKDLVEIEYYSPRYEERITRLFEIDFKHKDNITFGNTHCQLNIFDGEWGNHDQLLEPVIKSIVTKEQFESMEYRIGE